MTRFAEPQGHVGVSRARVVVAVAAATQRALRVAVWRLAVTAQEELPLWLVDVAVDEHACDDPAIERWHGCVVVDYLTEAPTDAHVADGVRAVQRAIDRQPARAELAAVEAVLRRKPRVADDPIWSALRGVAAALLRWGDDGAEVARAWLRLRAALREWSGPIDGDVMAAARLIGTHARNANGS